MEGPTDGNIDGILDRPSDGIMVGTRLGTDDIDALGEPDCLGDGFEEGDPEGSKLGEYDKKAVGTTLCINVGIELAKPLGSVE